MTGWMCFFTFIELSMFMNRFTRQQINIMLNYMHAKGNVALYGWRKKIYFVTILCWEILHLQQVFSFLKRSMCHFSHERAQTSLWENVLTYYCMKWSIKHLGRSVLSQILLFCYSIFKLCICWKSSPLPLHLDYSARIHVDCFHGIYTVPYSKKKNLSKIYFKYMLKTVNLNEIYSRN